ncbi:uncharacterized protein LOC105188934 [Harpegnathos saltator]|uniref:U5 small nuclear ribonucleoprotein TSSC4 n=1 Tax=Harpegnathos saltator TaxID=610380 RepID=E2C1J1_HARSA|nr:uncharacterized protein LOC105188934 [Harpegnathos saltator]EFN78167.1 hypothetical protein EAI_08139 [Harpegnathos saltator]
MHTSTNFVLRGGDEAFANRQKLLFDQLSIAENKCNKHDRCEVDGDNTEMHVDVDKHNRSSASKDDLKRRRETRKFCGKESIFKRPEGRAPRTSFRGVPDYHKNPHKWIKYSLADVSNEDMTEHSNTQAAMSFLKELKARRKKEEANELKEKMDIESCDSNAQDCKETVFKHKKRKLTSQIVFMKPQTKETEDSQMVAIEATEKPMFRSSKIILPEYVIGQRPKKISKQNRPVIKGDRLKELRLDHLEEPDEEEEEDN